MECVICYETTNNKVYPCEHAICESCISKWIIKKHIECPMCRQTVCRIYSSKNFESNFVIEFPENTHAGITIRNCKKGSIITKVNKKDQGYKCGLRRGYIIVSVNEILCKDIGSPNVAKMLTQASLYKIDCCCTIYMSNTKKILNKVNGVINHMIESYRVFKKRNAT